MTASTDASHRPEAIRALVARCSSASLATVRHDGGGPGGPARPYASLVETACTASGLPVLLISRLAWHSRNLMANPAASLLFCGPRGAGSVLESTRVTLLGTMARTSDEQARAGYLARHAGARMYARFADFSWWCMQVETVHVVAGFGRIETLSGADVFPGPCGLDTMP